MVAGAGAATPEAFLPEIGDAVLTGLTYLGRSLLTLGEGVVGGVVLPAAALVGGALWPSSTSSNDTLTGQADAGGASPAQSSPPDSNAPPPPPSAVSPSGQPGSPTGPEDPDGNSTVRGSQPSRNAPGTVGVSGASPPNLAPEGADQQTALDAVKEALGIPLDEDPEVLPNYCGGTKAVPGSETLRYLDDDGEIVDIRHDYDGHNFSDDPTQNRGPHFNAPDGGHYDYQGPSSPYGPLRR